MNEEHHNKTEMVVQQLYTYWEDEDVSKLIEIILHEYKYFENN